jgi:hypothetical protein
MFKTKHFRYLYFILIVFFISTPYQKLFSQKNKFKVIAFYTAKNDQAHISFVHEANKWFPSIANKYHFTYDSTNDWSKLNDTFLHQYQVVLFLDTRPELPEQRVAFENYMNNGGAWMGFHFSAFALTPSTYSQNWNWYHNSFLGSGEYKSNTWRPTQAYLKVEDKYHPSTKHLSNIITATPNEWYAWKNDLKSNPNIRIILSIDSSSFPLGTGPKPYEIWHSGYYPVAWTNINYKMIYVNMGHNDIDYEHNTNKQLSSTFANKELNIFFINSILWLGRKQKATTLL